MICPLLFYCRLTDYCFDKMARRWNNEEVNALVETVGENYHFLTSALSSTKTKTMIEDKWKKIAGDIYVMDMNSPPYPVDKVKRKWFDLNRLWGAICKSLHLHILGQKTALNEMHLSPFANVFAI